MSSLVQAVPIPADRSEMLSREPGAALVKPHPTDGATGKSAEDDRQNYSLESRSITSWLGGASKSKEAVGAANGSMKEPLLSLSSSTSSFTSAQAEAPLKKSGVRSMVAKIFKGKSKTPQRLPPSQEQIDKVLGSPQSLERSMSIGSATEKPPNSGRAGGDVPSSPKKSSSLKVTSAPATSTPGAWHPFVHKKYIFLVDPRTKKVVKNSPTDERGGDEIIKDAEYQRSDIRSAEDFAGRYQATLKKKEELEREAGPQRILVDVWKGSRYAPSFGLNPAHKTNYANREVLGSHPMHSLGSQMHEILYQEPKTWQLLSPHRSVAMSYPNWKQLTTEQKIAAIMPAEEVAAWRRVAGLSPQ